MKKIVGKEAAVLFLFWIFLIQASVPSLAEWPKEKVYESSGTALSAEKGSALAAEPDRLSDVFFQGVNYIDYINAFIANNMEEALSYFATEYGDYQEISFIETGEGEGVYVWDLNAQMAILKRPFGGYPNDYSLFQVDEGKLVLFVGEDDPYFTPEIRAFGRPRFEIPLTPDISPYGKKHVRFHYKSEEIGDHSAVLPRVEIIGATTKNTEDRINEYILEMYQDVVAWTAEKDEAIAKGLEKDFVFSVLLYPFCSVRDGYISVSFGADYLEEGPTLWEGTEVVRGGVYSIETGELIDLKESITDAWMFWNGKVIVRFADGTEKLFLLEEILAGGK